MTDYFKRPSNTSGGVHRWRDAAALRRASPKGTGVFRCERCQNVFPDSAMEWQDGKRYCRHRCRDLLSAIEQQELLAEARATVDPFDPVEFSPAGFFADAVAVTSLTDASGNTIDQASPVTITNGGAAVEVNLNGVGLSSSDTLAYPSGVTDDSGPTYTSSVLTTLSLVASGATQGAGDLTFNSTKFRGVIFIRG